MENDSPHAPPASDDTTPSPSSSSSSSSLSSAPSYTARVSRTCVYPPTIIRIRDPDSSDPPSLLQFSLHTAPLTLKRELHTILPTLNPADTLLILPTFQPSHTPLTTFTTETEAAKNRLLETFSGFARQLCLTLTARGYFADYIDPCTGLPALTAAGGAVWSEVDGVSALLRYRVEQAGCCSIVLHPVWGSACYPASCVTNARVEAVLEGMERVRRRWEVKEEQKDEEKEERKEATEETSTDQPHNTASTDDSSDRKRQQRGKVAEEEKKEGVQQYDEMQRIVAVSPAANDC